MNSENEIKLPFPPIITVKDLQSSKKIPNSFIIYRMALRKYVKSKNIIINRKRVSSLASRLWKLESDVVKSAYKKLGNDAKILRNNSQEDATVTPAAISGENYFTSSSALSQQENLSSLENQPSFETLTTLTTPILDSSVPDTNIVQCAQILEQQPLFCHNDGNLIELNDYSNENYSACLQQFTNGIDQRVQILEQKFNVFYQFLYENGFVTGSGLLI
jgi:hypothetical protein